MSIIEVKGLSKRYRIGLKEKRADTFAGQLLNTLRAPIDNFRQLRSLSKFKDDDESVFWALRDINFTVEEGEVLGIIGHNGAGKSTLLKILSRITEPTGGEVRIKGRVAALLEVGTGFHQELTGRENIYMNGTILGMTRREIDRKLDEIVDFSGVEKYIDTPVKFYSSGMKVRLGFSVAAHLEPEILIIDEVLAVGDFEFQRKCIGKMNDISSNQGRTVIFVSHDMTSIFSLCSSAILLKKGILIKNGGTKEIIKVYTENNGIQDKCDFENYSGNGNWIPLELIFIDTKEGNTINTLQTGQNLTIRIKYKKIKPGLNPIIILTIKNSMDLAQFFCFSKNSHPEIIKLMESGNIDINIKNLPLLPGRYKIDLTLKYDREVTFQKENLISFEVLNGDFYGTGKLDIGLINCILVPHSWKIC